MNFAAIGKRLLVILLLLLFCVQSGSSTFTKSATWDETCYFGVGQYLMKHLRWDVPESTLHPPLSYYLTSIPLLFSDIYEENLWEYRGKNKNIYFLAGADIQRGQILLSSRANDNDRLLFLSRLMIIALGLLLGFFVYLFSSKLYGWKGGIVSLFFFAFCPNMLAHAGLITTDMTITVFFFITIYYFRMCLIETSYKNSILAGISLGLALLSKFTALLLFPIEVVLLMIFLMKEGTFPYRYICIPICCAVFILLIGYGFDITPYIQGIVSQYSHASHGHPSFLMGEHSTKGWWYYFIFAFLIKTPVAMLLLFITALFLFFINTMKKIVRMDDLFLLIPIFAVFVFFSINHQSIGLRYILPVYPFIFVLAGGIVVQFKKIQYLSYILIAWYALSSVSIYPDYLAYFNEIVGGPKNGYRYLVDSNLDWGQDLKGLKKFMDKNKIERIYLSYFGTDSPERYGIQYDRLPSYYLKNPESLQNIKFPIKGYIAISATNLQGVYLQPQNMFQEIAKNEPVEQIGHSIFIYYIK
jgi:4-amino-4-deoxy-L-arabinose transferase-like glycosyltransferase